VSVILEDLDIRPSTPAADAARDAFVRAHPRGSVFHRAGWRDAVERAFGHEGADLLAWRGAELVGVLPLMLSPALGPGWRLISVPYGVYGGPLGIDAVVEQRLLDKSVALAERLAVGHLELRYQYDPGPELVGSDLYWTFVRDLPEAPEEVLARMPKKARAEARKARERHGLELSSGSWYVDDLHRLFLANKQRLGSPGLPIAFFRELLDVFGQDVSVHLVRKERRPLAAVMAFHHGDTLVAYYSGTTPEADREWSASNFMYLALQEWGVRAGFRRFDFGRSRRDSGAFQFKLHQGFEPRPLAYRYHLVRDRRLPAFNPSNPRTAGLRATWSRLPPWLTARLSDRLARYLP
jgi:FemAB-related protein (PEP-CTERM system-associated)